MNVNLKMGILTIIENLKVKCVRFVINVYAPRISSVLHHIGKSWFFGIFKEFQSAIFSLFIIKKILEYQTRMIELGIS